MVATRRRPPRCAARARGGAHHGAARPAPDPWNGAVSLWGEAGRGGARREGEGGRGAPYPACQDHALVRGHWVASTQPCPSQWELLPVALQADDHGQPRAATGSEAPANALLSSAAPALSLQGQATVGPHHLCGVGEGCGHETPEAGPPRPLAPPHPEYDTRSAALKFAARGNNYTSRWRSARPGWARPRQARLSSLGGVLQAPGHRTPL